MEQADLHQLFNTTWTIHRLSPLHHGKDCETLLDNQVALKTYATRLRDHLTGDILAGLQTSTGAADDDAFSKTGALKNCLWQQISPQSPHEARSRHATFSGILITLEYENIIYKAALLAEKLPKSKGSTTLPLLLTRFPTPLRQTFLAFLSANFDTYISPLKLRPNFLCAGLETYVETLRSRSASETVEDAIKELQLTLSFSSSIAPALKSLNVSVSRTALADFLRDVQLPKRSLKQKLRSPLIANLSSYLETHLAMKVDLEGSSQPAKQHVRLSKITCAAFVLGGEGRVKLVVAADKDGEDENTSVLGAEELLRSVVRRAVVGDQPTT
jgi:hypothetical protein